jgi:hypothetical protein
VTQSFDMQAKCPSIEKLHSPNGIGCPRVKSDKISPIVNRNHFGRYIGIRERDGDLLKRLSKPTLGHVEVIMTARYLSWGSE